jgi:Family of unknown function (DUF6058)
VLTDADLAYIRAGFVPLGELAHARGAEPDEVRAQIEAGLLPKPAYVLDDGTEMVAPDYFALVDSAGGVERLKDHFLARHTAASVEHERPDAEEEWEAYLSGEYGVCLREVTPENIARKSSLVARIERLLAEPLPDDTGWSHALAAAVDELDALEREFAPYDRVRWGPVSRDRLITAVRDTYPDAFVERPAAIQRR